MTDEHDPIEQGPVDAERESPDPSTQLVASIQSALEAKVPDVAQRTEVTRTIERVVRESSYMFAGPVPPPQMLAEYDRVCPGWASRILEQGEREQLARIEREKEQLAQTRLMIEAEVSDNKSCRNLEGRGQIFGFIAFIIIAAVGLFALYKGATTVAVTCFTTFALGIVGMFLASRKKGESEAKLDNESKNEDS